jgi:O-acetyl-ADP-ribose deacetylase (regulator of RNase III)
MRGDIFKVGAQALVNPVNCVGVAGRGLALEFKMRFPKSFAEYKNACKMHQIAIGKMFTTRENDTTWIVNFPTKKHWQENSQLDYIIAGLKDLTEVAIGFESMAIPMLGCGLGRLDWGLVKPLIFEAFKDSSRVIKVVERE